MGSAWILAMVLAATALSAAEPPAHFLVQHRSECRYTQNGTRPEAETVGIRLIESYIYDRAEFVRFDSDRGTYEAVSTLGEPDAQYWNSQEAVLQRKRAAVETFCRNNYGNAAPFADERRVQPKIKITPTEHDASSQRILLICTVAGFWPAEIEVTWFRNGVKEEGDQVMSTDLTRNGDWTFQIQVMLEAEPARGDVYACQVEHATFATPARVQWEPQSDSARSKMWTGVAGLILGLAFLAPGLILYLKNKKGDVLPQPPVALMS